MKPTSELFELIKSLSKGEKRQFKLHASGAGPKSYVELFDAIEKMKEYDEYWLKRKYKNAPFIKYLSVTKRYLYDQILVCLRSNATYSSPEYQAAGIIADILILQKKGLFEQANHKLTKAKKEFTEQQEFKNLYVLHSAEQTLLSRWYDPKKNERLLKHLDEQNRVHKIVGHMDLMVAVNSRMRVLSSKHKTARTDDDKAKALEIAKPLLAIDPDLLESFEAAGNYHRFFCEYYYYIGEPEKSLQHARAQFPLYERQSAIIRKKFYKRYIGIFSVYLIACETSKFFDDHSEYLAKLRPMTNNNLRAFEIWAIHTLSYFNAVGQFDKAVAHIEEIEPHLEAVSVRILRTHVMHFPIQISRAYLGAGDYNNALKWNLKLLDKDAYQQDIFYFAKITQLICHLELGNFDILESLLRSTYRALYNHNRFFKLQELLLQVIRKLMTMADRRELSRVLAPLLPELKALKNNPLEWSFFQFFDFEAWVRSKVERKPFAQAVKEGQEAERLEVRM